MDDAIGAKAICSQCGAIIEWGGQFWRHLGEAQPKHPVIPGERLTKHKVELRLDLEAIGARLEKARDADRDYSLVVDAALHDAEKMLLALRALLGKRAV